MGKLDTDPTPPHAITMWMTDKDIVALLPMRDGGIPYMMKFPRNEGGLSQALQLLQKRKEEVLSPTEAKEFDVPRTQPQVKLGKIAERLHAETTPEQRANAQALLRKLGLVKP